MVAIKQLAGAIVVTLLTAGCTMQSPTRPISGTVQPSAQLSPVSSKLTAQQEMELYKKQMNQSIAQTDNTPAIVVGQDGAFLGVVSSDQYADKSICNQFGNFGNGFSSTSVLNKYAQYGGTYSDMGAYNPNAQQPPLIIQNGQPIGLLTKNRRLQGGVDPDVFFNQVCSR